MADRIRPWLLGGMIVALLGVAVLGPLGRQSPEPDRAHALEQRLRCPVCRTVSIAESPSETAASMRRIVETQVARGRSDAEVMRYFEARYGKWVVNDPPRAGITLPLWLLPIAAAGLATLLVIMRTRSRRGTHSTAELTPDDLALLETAKTRRRIALLSNEAEDEP